MISKSISIIRQTDTLCYECMVRMAGLIPVRKLSMC
jgi:hypothetical protein